MSSHLIRKMNEEESKRVKENMDLILWLSKKELAEKRNDFHQDLALTLCMAAQAYRPDQGASFRTYVSTCLKNKTIDYRKREAQKEYLEAFEFCDEIEPMLSEKADPEEEIAIDAAWTALEQMVWKSAAQYSPNIKKGVTTLLLIARGYTRAQIASKLEVPPIQVTAWCQAAKKKLSKDQEIKKSFCEYIGRKR